MHFQEERQRMLTTPTLQASRRRWCLTLVGGDVSINDLIEALNQLGVKPRDLGQILQAIKASGAMRGLGGYMSAVDPLAIGRIMNANLGDTQRQEIASEEFESYLIGMLIKEMRKTIPEGMFSSSAMDTFTEMMDQALANNWLKMVLLGFAEAMLKDVKRRNSITGEKWF